MSTLRIGSNVVVPVLRVPTGLPRDVDTNGVWGYPPTPFSFNLPSTATSVQEGILLNAFKDCTTIVSANMGSLIEVTGVDTMEGFCEGATNLTSVDLSHVVTISGSGTLDRAFYGTALTSVNLSSLTTINGTVMSSTFANCVNLTSIDLSSLTSIGNGVSLNGTFGVSTNATLPLTSVTFTSLSSISGTAPMRNIFGKRDGIVVSFPAFNSSTFGQQTTYLDNIVSGAVGATVHFPSNMQSVIGSWSSVQNGFGGTNTTVLFDLPATE